MIMLITSDNIKNNIESRNNATFCLSTVQVITTLLFHKPFARKTPVIKIKWKKSKAVYTWVRSSFQWFYCIKSYWIYQIDPRELVKTLKKFYEISYISINILSKYPDQHHKRIEDNLCLKFWNYTKTQNLFALNHGKIMTKDEIAGLQLKSFYTPLYFFFIFV